MKIKIEDAVDYALANGLIKYNTQFKLTHAPFCLSPFSLLNQELTDLTESTPLFNELMIKVGSDHEFIQTYLEPVAKTDAFIRSLLKLYSETEISHHLQLSRNDFLFTKNEQGSLTPKQVEFNTISNSFLYLSQKMVQLHHHMEQGLQCNGQLVDNKTLDQAVQAMAEVVEYYGKSDAGILMVVQKKEQNLFDQRGIEYKLWEDHGIVTLRKTLEEIAETGRLKEGHLEIDNRIIALTYYRAGYTPDDFKTESAWAGRSLIENSSTVKCPSVGMQLAGAKKVQQILAKPEILKHYLEPDQISSLSKAFVGMYDLDEEINGISASELAVKTPRNYVLKPQREGGGNNLYDDEMVARIKTLSDDEQKAYVLMERIVTPFETSVLVVDRVSEETQTVSEIGRYGACMFDGNRIRFNRDIGYLVRTKSSDQNEGGVCAGYACLNSLCVR